MNPGASGRAGRPGNRVGSTLAGRIRRAAGGLLALALAAGPAAAPVPGLGAERGEVVDRGAVVALEGSIRRDANAFYLLSDLAQGQTLAVHVRATSGNLDPAVALVDGRLDDETLERRVAEVEAALAGGQDLPSVLPELADELFLAWDDDAGEGYAAKFEAVVPADGDYQLLVLASPGGATFGDYRLLIGLDAPEVLGGEAEPRGALAVTRDRAAARPQPAVQEVDGTLDANQPEVLIPLEHVRPDDQLQALLEVTSGDLVARLTLEDFGGKRLESAETVGEPRRASLGHEVVEGGSNFALRLGVIGQTGGDYRLLIGLNAPDLATAAPMGRSLVAQPTEVGFGIRLDQITDVDQKAENFGVVADLRMTWRDPKLAFSPDSCQCTAKLMLIGDFFKHAQERGTRWPETNLFNQQGRRWGQGEVVEIFADGRAVYSERFSATLQAPDFDFRRYPFDQQKFAIRFLSVFPEADYVYVDLPGYSNLGQELGEEEWLITDFTTVVDSVDGHPRFSYVFGADRHLAYYVVRIFLPVSLIILVSWFVFFLRDYSKRIDLAGGNLLLFIAFNFTISGDLPRLGYLTFLDMVLVCTFVITGLVLAFNVYLRWLEVGERVALTQTLDRYTLWIYPAGYLLTFAAVAWLYLA